MLSFTLDTNCIIDVAEGRPEAPAVMALAKAHAEHKADVAIAAVSASERQQGDTYLDSYKVFRARLEALSLGHLTEVQGIGYFDISYFDHALFPSTEMTAREAAIHAVLFPNVAFRWGDFAAATGLGVDAIKDAKAKRWRNAFCDRQMFWAHDHAKRDVFVTSDGNFSKLVGLADFATAKVMSPSDAVKML